MFGREEVEIRLPNCFRRIPQAKQMGLGFGDANEAIVQILEVNVVRGILPPASAFALEAKPAKANLACSTLLPRRANLIRDTER